MKYYHFIAEKNKNKQTNKQRQTKCKQYPTDSEQNKLCSYDTFSNSQNMKQRRPSGKCSTKNWTLSFSIYKIQSENILLCQSRVPSRSNVYLSINRMQLWCNGKVNHKHQVRTAISSSSIRKYFGIRYFKIIQKTF